MLRPLALALVLTTPAAAEPLVEAELLPGWTTGSGTRMAGLHLRLAPGWKTYWRAPGEAGIPPEFDWTGSQNLKGVRLHWPAPERFETNGFTTLGFHGDVVIPVEIAAQDPGQPVTLRLDMALGVCSDVCVPATLEVSGTLTGETADRAIRTALARRPASAEEAGVQHVSCEAEPIRDGLRIAARIDIPGARGDEVVVMEAGEPGVWVSGAEVRQDGGELVAVADMVPPEAAPFALDRGEVRLTVVGAGEAVEIRGCPAP